ncbi:transposase [Dyadobacter sp. CY323]|uniref:transposase n=1 Tax=Dyadobacter sp. CY323 TaxID=2907302 RepID=UPI001F21E79A|nr:transposase [Dyadobacter sp. CY323]MCE6990182.1 transposase [Dyadobacter sp. CY323]
MSAGNLIDVYKNEEMAVLAFRDLRLRKGVTCKKCGKRDHYWLASKQQFQCKHCRFRTTLQSGTVLEGSKLPISYFFIAVYLMLKEGNAFTVQDLQEQTGHKYYEPLYDFARKIRAYLNESDQNGILITFVEISNQLINRQAPGPQIHIEHLIS